MTKILQKLIKGKKLKLKVKIKMSTSNSEFIFLKQNDININKYNIFY